MTENVAELGYWSGNEVVRHSMEHRAPGVMVLPKLAGLNEYRELSSCAIFYSSKPLPQDEALKAIFEMTEEEILAARENEDIFQFAFRGALRGPTYADDYDIYLYSVDQAERLKSRMDDNGFTDVEIVPIPEAGIMKTRRPLGNRSVILSPAEAEAKLKKKRADNARRNRESRARKNAALAETPP